MDFVEICTIIYALKYYVKTRTRRKTNAQPLDPFNVKLLFIQYHFITVILCVVTYQIHTTFSVQMTVFPDK